MSTKNLPINFDDVISMTSLEIAELTGKLHKNVIRDCEVLTEVAGLKFELSDITYKDSTGRSLKAYRLSKKATFVLVSGYSPELRLKCYDHIEALELQVKRLEEDKKRVAIQSANRRGVTWGDYCKVHGLPAQKLWTAYKKLRRLFRVRMNGTVQVNPNYEQYFKILKPTDHRFNSSGINFRFNAKGLEYFSRPKAVNAMRSYLVEALGTDQQKADLLRKQAKGNN